MEEEGAPDLSEAFVEDSITLCCGATVEEDSRVSEGRSWSLCLLFFLIDLSGSDILLFRELLEKIFSLNANFEIVAITRSVSS